MTKPDPSLLDKVVASEVLAAWRAASAALTRAGVAHVVVGGLAVGANGYPRATKDVDFLVADNAFVRHAGGLVTMNPALPIQVDGVAVDYLSPRDGEAHLAAALVESPGDFLDAPRLVYMKLRAGRMRDKNDIVGLILAGVDVTACRGYLTAHAAELVPGFEKLVTQAAAEE